MGKGTLESLKEGVLETLLDNEALFGTWYEQIHQDECHLLVPIRFLQPVRKQGVKGKKAKLMIDHA